MTDSNFTFFFFNSSYLGQPRETSIALLEQFLNVKKHFVGSETLQVSIGMRQLLKVTLQVIAYTAGKRSGGKLTSAHLYSSFIVIR